MSKEIRIPHQKLQNPQSIRSEMEAEFDACGVDLHRHEVTHMEDDFKKGERVVRVKNTKYFVQGK